MLLPMPTGPGWSRTFRAYGPKSTRRLGVVAGAGLVAFLGANLLPGAPLVVDAAGLDRALEGARLVFTGEGRVDAQTAYGKGPSEVAKSLPLPGPRVSFISRRWKSRALQSFMIV